MAEVGWWPAGSASRLLALIRRPPVHGWEKATVKFRKTVDLLEHGWFPITAATVVSHLSLYLVLLVCLRDVGISDAEVGWAGSWPSPSPAWPPPSPSPRAGPGWWRRC